METDLSIRCTCGALHGLARSVSSHDGNRVICYCDDCQLFAHFLGRVDEILDAHGGTDIFQMSPAHLHITQGAEHLTCMRLAPKGILRWYTDCCKTPIGNTLATHHVPFVGLIHTCIGSETGSPSCDAMPGPVRMRVHGRFATGDRTRLNAHDRISRTAMLRVATRLLAWRLRGDHKRSPFFDAHTGRPSAQPYVLSADELYRLRAARAEWSNAATD